MQNKTGCQLSIAVDNSLACLTEREESKQEHCSLGVELSAFNKLSSAVSELSTLNSQLSTAGKRHTPIASTLGFILSEDRQSVLMVHRTYRESDENLGKYNGIGGKLERDEDVASGMMREVMEETGLTVTSMQLRGTVAWADFGPKKEDWLAFIFLIDGVTGNVNIDNEEGSLHWIPISEIGTLPMWAGDRLFIPMVFDDDPKPFHGFMRYEGDTPAEWRYSRL